MNDEISVRLHSPTSDVACTGKLDTSSDAGGGDRDLPGPWGEALCHLIASHAGVDPRKLEAFIADDGAFLCSSVDDAAPHEEAAQIALGIYASQSDDAASRALTSSFFLLHQKGFGLGRSPADHWRQHRLLDAGSRALDAMVEHPRLRRCALATLFFRLVRRGIEQGTVSEQGVSGEFICDIPWSEGGERPWRQSLPTRESPGGWGETIIDWLLEQLLARGLMSLSLGSVIEEEGEKRHYRVDDALGGWMGDIAGEEGRFVAGALFMPVRLGGWSPPLSERVADTAAVARQISDDFVPDDRRKQAYRQYLRQLDALRRSPDELSPTYELCDGDSRWRGRFAAIIHPARRRANGHRAYCAVEAGVVFDEDRPQLPDSPRRRQKALQNTLLTLAQEADDEIFESFGTRLDEVVDLIHRDPHRLQTENIDPGKEPSPLWRDFDAGYDALCGALERGDAQELAIILRRWTFPFRSIRN